MFNQLSNRLDNFFSTLRRKTLIEESDIKSVVRQLRIIMLEADVALPVVKSFTVNLEDNLIGARLDKSLRASEVIYKNVYDELIRIISFDQNKEVLKREDFSQYLLVGLQGTGKTTTACKLAKFLIKKDIKTLVVSLDIHRPAAYEQMIEFCNKNNLYAFVDESRDSVKEIYQRALEYAKSNGFKAMILDSAGRLDSSDDLMNELIEIQKISKPTEVLLTVDALMGQDSLRMANSFKDKIKVSGIIMTRMDADSRGGALFSIKSAVGLPIKLLGNGELVNDIIPLEPDRIVKQILGEGDFIGLVENAREKIDENEAKKSAEKLMEGNFSLVDMKKQFEMIVKMGGMSGILSMMPRASKIKGLLNDNNERKILRQIAIIDSMTPLERDLPKILNASRKKRVANGSGVSVMEVNLLLKQYMEMLKMSKNFKNMGSLKKVLGSSNINLDSDLFNKLK